jgi:hypothetical protein
VHTVTIVLPFWASISESLVIESSPTGFSSRASVIIPLNCVDLFQVRNRKISCFQSRFSNWPVSGAQFAVMGFIHLLGVLMSSGRAVWYGVVVVVALWGALLRRLYCRGGGWVVVVMVGLPWWWLCCCGGGCTIVIVVALSSWCHGPRYTCVGLGCSSFHWYGAPSLVCHPRLGFCCRSSCHEDFPTPGLNPRVVV